MGCSGHTLADRLDSSFALGRLDRAEGKVLNKQTDEDVSAQLSRARC